MALVFTPGFLGLRRFFGFVLLFTFFDADGYGLGKIPVGNGFDVGIDVAVEHMNDASGVGS